MSRSIKYRQRVYENGKFSYFHYWGIIDIDGDGYRQWVSPLTYKLGVTDPKDSEQFTGLTDRNGVEVYEGDVLDLKYYYEHDVMPSHVYNNISVEYVDSLMSFMGIGLQSHPCHIKGYQMEVTGNIHTP
jgi:hypothetical protein